MKLGILDQSPVPEGRTAHEALLASLELAQEAERLGYSRYWIAEHHNMTGLACSAPEVMLPYIGAQTSHIKIGSGAVLLPYYKPYKVAETYNMLATLFPGRIDLGIGRAPGGSAETSMALSDNFLKGVAEMPDKITELLNFLVGSHPEGHMYSKVAPAPVPRSAPLPWILGTSKKSAIQAAEKGTAYCFGHFMSDQNPEEIISLYKNNYIPSKMASAPYCLAAVNVICAETEEQAEELAIKSRSWRNLLSGEEAQLEQESLNTEELLQDMKKKMIIGNPVQAAEQLESLASRIGADELMIITLTTDYQDRLHSYRLIAEQML
ncbi:MULTISPECIES: LLM class flavin-dependent oxidoreductase [Bacillaceae]|uniref:LLM class flavin-dependent oxidoreductase n=1 Tax=Bacillaceae TaxID=186817 RepID=UPI0029656B49|nr:LLM class flavin-dependent oxidoreductase [Bacillus infantis]MDW2879024.1 LLM class flavin-dependent oxidoreductase [Bacillus infantis]